VSFTAFDDGDRDMSVGRRTQSGEKAPTRTHVTFMEPIPRRSTELHVTEHRTVWKRGWPIFGSASVLSSDGSRHRLFVETAEHRRHLIEAAVRLRLVFLNSYL